jgi:GTP-binding protein YchF
VGIVGLPNVGKSTLFNALLKRQVAFVANFPFATIEPNIGVVPVPDFRLEKLANVVKTEKIVPATVKFVDIAGLVKGASKGEGLGNKFLSHIREVDAIVYLLRDFSDENVIRAGSTDPTSDFEVLEAELMLADLETVSRIRDGKDRGLRDLAQKIAEGLEKGIPVREMKFTETENKEVHQMSFLTNKGVIKVLNVDEDKIINNLQFTINNEIRICAKMEEELAGLTEEEQKQYLADLGVTESGLERLIKKAFDILGLQTFLTAGEIEARAWTIKKGAKAPQAAGVIHTDFEKHFIKADVINWEEFVKVGGWIPAREQGKVRMEGREYLMAEGDVVEFKIGI